MFGREAPLPLPKLKLFHPNSNLELHLFRDDVYFLQILLNYFYYYYW